MYVLSSTPWVHSTSHSPMQSQTLTHPQLTQQTQTATQVQYDRAGNAIAMADAEIARFRAIIREIDELQVEFDKVRRIGEIVKGFKSRVDHLNRRI